MGGTIPGRRCPVVVGREALLQEACAAIAAAALGRGGGIALVGEEGSGKSRVLAELIEAARAADLAVGRGRAVPGGRPSSLRPLAEATAALLRDGGVAGDGTVPFLSVPRRPAGEDPLAVAGSTLRLLRAVSTTGVLLLLEDLHWSDPETLDAVESLADSAGDERLLLVVTARPGLSPTADDLLHRLGARGALTAHTVGALHRADLQRMAEACLGGAVSPALVELLAERSGGLPLLVEELVDAWREHGTVVPCDGAWEVACRPHGDIPAWVITATRDRLALLDGPGRAVVGAAAVLGRGFDWRAAAAVAGVDEEAAGRAVGAACEVGLLEAGPGVSALRHRFRRALTRDAVLATLSPWERQRLCHAALRCRGGAGEETGPAAEEELAELAEGAGDVELATRLLLAAGHRHHRDGSLARAELMLQRGLGLGGVAVAADLATELVEVLALAGRAGRARRAGDTWHGRVGRASPALHARLHLAQARAAQTRGDWDAAWRHVDAARSLGLAGAPARRAEVVAAGIRVTQGGGGTLPVHPVRGLHEGGPPEQECEALEVLGTSARTHDLAEAEWLLSRMHNLAEAHSLGSWRRRSLVGLGVVDVLRLREPRDLAEVRQAAINDGDLHSALILGLLDALRRHQVFDLDRCEQLLVEVAATAAAHRLTRAGAAARHLLAASRIHAGARCEDALGGELAPEASDAVGRALVHALGALVDEEHGAARGWLDRAAAAAEARSVLRRARWSGEWGIRALMHALDGDAAAVRELREQGMGEHRVNAGLAAWCDAVLAGDAGRAEEATAHAAMAMSLLAAAPWYDAIARRLVAGQAVAAGWGSRAGSSPRSTFVEAAGQVAHRWRLRSAAPARGPLRSPSRARGAPARARAVRPLRRASSRSCGWSRRGSATARSPPGSRSPTGPSRSTSSGCSPRPRRATAPSSGRSPRCASTTSPSSTGSPRSAAAVLELPAAATVRRCRCASSRREPPPDAGQRAARRRRQPDALDAHRARDPHRRRRADHHRRHRHRDQDEHRLADQPAGDEPHHRHPGQRHQRRGAPGAGRADDADDGRRRGARGSDGGPRRRRRRPGQLAQQRGPVSGSNTWTTSVTGSTPPWLITNARYIDSGALFTEPDVQDLRPRRGARSHHRADLFPGGDAIGGTVNVQSPSVGATGPALKVPFRVIGILQPRGAQGLFNPDDLVIVPLTTAQEMLITGGSLTSVQRILISATSREAIDAASDETNNLLMQTHRAQITDPNDPDFTITTQASILNTLDSTTTALTLLLAGVAGISLLVGGIGVMNIMLVSVTERINEIGLRKALGARRADILRQFLIEAASLSAAGGLMGVGLGAACSFALDHFTSLVTVFSPGVAAIGMLISIAIGVFFGVLPAMHAARLHPIQALRGA